MPGMPLIRERELELIRLAPDAAYAKMLYYDIARYEPTLPAKVVLSSTVEIITMLASITYPWMDSYEDKITMAFRRFGLDFADHDFDNCRDMIKELARVPVLNPVSKSFWIN